ncbi:Phospholipase A1-II 5 [Capsicum chinense]|nr:Phospholipase A1-II 5 [Capsicum chinense]
MESKFIALDKAGEEAEWIQNFLEDIPYWPKLVAPVRIHCDSQAAIGRTGSIMYNGKSRHLRRRHNTVRELLSSGIITVDYVNLKDNVSDPFTKGLSRERVERKSKGMVLRPRTSQHGGIELVIDTRKSQYLKDTKIQAMLHTVAGWNGEDGEFDMKVKRSLALVNKSSSILKDEILIQGSWCVEKNKGVVLDEHGEWILAPPSNEDIPILSIDFHIIDMSVACYLFIFLNLPCLL